MSDEPRLITEEYLKQSILTSYPQSTLDLFKELRPEEWERHFGKEKPKLRVVK